jgi:hypothetical protein
MIMTNDIREKAEALVNKIKNSTLDKYQNTWFVSVDEIPEFKALETALRPSRQEIANYLTDCNKWRRGGGNKQPDPKELGYYIDLAIEELKK